DDLDQNADADRVDDFRLAQVEKEDPRTVVHQLVRTVGDLLAAHVVDVALRVQDGPVGFPIDRHFQFLSHDFFSYLTMWMVVPPFLCVEISTSSICASMS